jgi:hypothetical protein
VTSIARETARLASAGAVVDPASRFYVRMAAMCLAVAVAGFAPTYWVPLLRGTLDVPALTHVHALFFYGWLVLFWHQTTLAASGRIGRHREVGVAGVALATGMCFVGLGMTIASLKRALALGAGDSGRAFAIVSFSAVVLFAGLFAAAIVNVKRPDVHKRLMLLTTVSMLQAGIGRWFLLFLAPAHIPGTPVVLPPVAVTILPAVVNDLLIAAAMVHDRRKRGRVHPAYWCGAAAVIAIQILRVPLSTSHAWLRVTDWLLAFSL